MKNKNVIKQDKELKLTVSTITRNGKKIYYNNLLSEKKVKKNVQKLPVQQHFKQNVPTNVTLNIKKPSKLKSPKSQMAKNLKPAH